MGRPRTVVSPSKQAPAGGNVTMHNALIGASHGLSLGEKRLISMAVAKLAPKDAELPLKPIRIRASDFAAQFDLDANTAYEQLREAQDHLFERWIRMLEPYGPGGSKLEVVKMRWVTSVRYRDGAGEIGLSFNPEIAQFLVQLKKHFTTYQLSKAAVLRSTYSWRVFENLERFRDTGIWDVDIERFHEIMETPASYRANFAQLRRFVIEPTIAELRAKTDIDADVEPVRRGRKITGLRFTFGAVSQLAMKF